jgi:hypothetical protein
VRIKLLIKKGFQMYDGEKTGTSTSGSEKTGYLHAKN